MFVNVQKGLEAYTPQYIGNSVYFIHLFIDYIFYIVHVYTIVYSI